ncbi:energy-coupling factor ABC transporter ATP-binding protein [Cohnella herbarum]|uniref:ABC transporter ATP-binding protein n=1 Tax=Cohnella herbarum TaxID=2728023 RepID=A0A7Z2VHU5_9BACL|nr:ABC transporter ATP-binding protein [Cohnella herbarum]QJD83292.1 ABC transporter ATP-binding protein [Cohnella herbarum]
MERREAEKPIVLGNVTVYGIDDLEGTTSRLNLSRLTLAAGEWLTVVGVNGSGKSTLARLLAGIEPERMIGTLERGFAGENSCPIVLQQPKAQLFGETPREEVMFALEWRGISAEHILEKVDQALHRVGLTALADEPWDRLSGGQQQLAAVSAATECDAPLLVLDEATSMLDEQNRDTVLRTAREFHARGSAVVWVTQRLDELEPDSRVVAVGEGSIIFDGTGREFMYGSAGDEQGEDGPISPCLRAGLRLPYLAEFAIELRRQGKIADPLPMTDREWRKVWESGGIGETTK